MPLHSGAVYYTAKGNWYTPCPLLTDSQSLPRSYSSLQGFKVFLIKLIPRLHLPQSFQSLISTVSPDISISILESLLIQSSLSPLPPWVPWVPFCPPFSISHNHVLSAVLHAAVSYDSVSCSNAFCTFSLKLCSNLLCLSKKQSNPYPALLYSSLAHIIQYWPGRTKKAWLHRSTQISQQKMPADASARKTAVID